MDQLRKFTKNSVHFVNRCKFTKNSVHFVNRCHKPDIREFVKVAFRTAMGFMVMGFVGFFVKLIFIPINNIIVGSA